MGKTARTRKAFPATNVSDLRRLLLLRMGFGHLVEVFLISAVVCVLSIRALLSVTGYPQIGVGGLHLAHVLFGGIGMVAALVLVMASLTKQAITLAAVIGGLGFGAFIDEIGKLVTNDSNYFYRPAVALMYVTFVAIYIASHAIERKVRPSPATYLANALDLVKEAAARDMDAEELREAREYISHCDQTDPIVASVAAILERVETVPSNPPGLTARIGSRAASAYRSIMQQPWFGRLLVAVFVATGFIALIEALIVLVGAERSSLTISGWGELLSEIAIGLLVSLGLLRLHHSRLAGYRMFARAVLVNILLGRVFAFYRSQFWAVFGLLASVVIWGITQYVIREEEMAQEDGENDFPTR